MHTSLNSLLHCSLVASFLLYCKAQLSFVKGIKEDYDKNGFGEKSTLDELADIPCKRRPSGAKPVTLKEKNDLMSILLIQFPKDQDG